MRLYLFLVAIIVSAFSSLAYGSQGLDLAFANYQKGDYELAYRQYRALAELGLADAQFNVGVMYLKGQHVDKDLQEAYAWTSLAGQQGDENHVQVSEQILAALDDESQHQKAQTRFDQLENQYSLTAVTANLEPVFSEDEPEIIYKPVKRKAPEYPRNAAISLIGGTTKVQFYIYPDGSVRYPVVMYAEPAGIFEESSLQSISRWKFTPPVTSSGESINKPQLVTQTIDYKLETDRTNSAVTRYVAKLQELVKQQDATAKYLYAVSAQSVNSVDLEQNEVDELMLQAALGGVPDAQYEIAQRLLIGERCQQDEKKAYRWLEIAALSDHAAAQYHLAKLPNSESTIFKNQGGDQWEYIFSAAKAGYPAAIMEMAWRLATAENATQNSTKHASELLDELPKYYRRDVRWYEIRAAIAATNGDYAQAVKRQKQAIKAADRLDWVTDELTGHLKLIQAKQSIVQVDLTIPDGIVST